MSIGNIRKKAKTLFRARKGLDFCYQCSEYESETCEKFEKLAKPYLEEDGVDMRANFERIRKGEIEEWLIESEEKYKCPVCGKPLSTGAIKRKCYHCEQTCQK